MSAASNGSHPALDEESKDSPLARRILGLLNAEIEEQEGCSAGGGPGLRRLGYSACAEPRFTGLVLAGGGDHAGGGNSSAAGRIVGAIPASCRAEPGLVCPIDLPLFLERGLLAWGLSRKSRNLSIRETSVRFVS